MNAIEGMLHSITDMMHSSDNDLDLRGRLVLIVDDEKPTEMLATAVRRAAAGGM